mgnify:FL=1
MDIYNSKIELECNCSQISQIKHEQLYKRAKKANGKKIRMMIKKQLPDLYNDLALEFPNPFESQSVKTEMHLIYIHSATDYFLKIIK